MLGSWVVLGLGVLWGANEAKSEERGSKAINNSGLLA